MIARLSGATRFATEMLAVARSASFSTTARYSVAVGRQIRDIVRDGNLVPADLRMLSNDAVFRVHGVTLVISGEAFGGAREMFARGVYWALPGFELAPGHNVVDLGANRGLFTLLAAKTGCSVIAVEAQHGFAVEIEQLLEKNGCKSDVQIVTALVGGGGVLSDTERLRTASHFAGAWPPIRTLSAILDGAGFERVDFLKCDIEGAEFVLFSDEDLPIWLPRVSRIAMEVHSDFGDPRRLVDTLETHGFTATLVDNRKRRVKTLSAKSGYLFAHR